MRRGLRGDSRNCFAGLRVSVLCAVCRCGRNGQLRSSGLARYLKAAGIEVMEVERPKRRHLRRNGKGRTPSMRRLLLGRSWPTTRPENPRAVMVSGGDDPDLEIGPSIGAEGPYTGRKPTAGSAGYRTGGPTPPSARTPYQESGRHLCPFPPWS